MAMLKIKNEQGGWDEILAIRGRDGAIQYTAGANIEISSDNVISAVGLEGTVTREDVQIMIGDAVPTKTSDLDNDSGFITNASIPSKTSDLTNDSDFITSSDVPTKISDLTNDSGFITAAQIPAEQEPDFNASVAKTITQTDINNWNGKQNPIQFNTAYSASTNKAATMADMPFVPTKLSDLTNDSGYALRSELPIVPTKVSDLTNDSGFVTSSSIPTKTSDLTNDSNFATLNDIPNVPTKTSELTNDAGFVTNSSLPTNLSDLTNDAGYITSADIPADNVAQGTGSGSRILNYNSTDNRANQEIIARGSSSVAEGFNTVASGLGSHAEGYNFYTKLTVGSASIAGNIATLHNIINVPYSVVVGTNLLSVRDGVVVTVTAITRNSYYADITVKGPSSWKGNSDNYYIINAAGSASHVEGQDCIAAGSYSHAEGSQTATLGSASHAQGLRCLAIGSYSHAGGYNTNAEATASTAQGNYLTNGVEDSTLVGCYGELDATNDADTMFAVANGADSSNLNIGLKFVGRNGNGKLYVEGVQTGPDPTTYTGYDATKTQVLKNVQGTFTWVDEV